MSVITRATRRHIPEYGILLSHHRENRKFYITLTGWTPYWRRNVSPVKHELGFISQKTAFFIVTAVKILSLSYH
jgi:hypothetical protein